MYLRRITLPEFRITERARRSIEPITSADEHDPEFLPAQVVLTTTITGAWITTASRKHTVCNACAELSATIQDSTSSHYDGEITNHDIILECVRLEGSVVENSQNLEQYLTEVRKQVQIAASMHELASLFACPNDDNVL